MLTWFCSQNGGGDLKWKKIAFGGNLFGPFIIALEFGTIFPRNCRFSSNGSKFIVYLWILLVWECT
ncbi:hypothetical protein HanIR_Chr11g0514101 [Helianthus annuus]|nr:hypothetical protein HanIR_Chr11g0514101 [Helianthus annuus]